MKPLYKFYGDLLLQAYNEKNLRRSFLIQKEAVRVLNSKQYRIFTLYYNEMCKNQQKTSPQNAI
jgi:hypothetical protein